MRLLFRHSQYKMHCTFFFPLYWTYFLNCVPAQQGRAQSVCICICVFFEVSPSAISALSWERRELSSKQLFQHKTVAFPCRWWIQVRCGGRGGIRLRATSVNHTVLPHRRHLSPNTKGFSPRGNTETNLLAYMQSIQLHEKQHCWAPPHPFSL